MKIAIVNPPWVSDGATTGVRSGSRWPHIRSNFFKTFPFPFQLAYASAVLKRRGHEVLFRDCIADGTPAERLIVLLRDFSPDIVFHEATSPTLASDRSFMESVKADIGCTVVCGGQLATSFPERILDIADYAIAGECEEALARLTGAISEHAPVDAIAGLAFRRNGTVTKNPPELIADVDSLPWPDRSCAPIARYQETFTIHHPDATMISSRGCPFRCTFCLESFVFNHKANYRARRVRDVVDEMAYLRDTFGVREIYFDDTSFTTDRTRVREICQELIDRRTGFFWSCMGDARIDRETLAMMKRAGCCGMKIGVETINPKTLKAIDKPVTSADVAACVENCRALGIFIHGTFIIGLPEETAETIDRTIEFAFRSPFDWMQFSPAIPYPGTPFFAQAQRSGWLISENWEGASKRLNVNLNYPGLPAEVIEAKLRTAQRLLNRRVFARPRIALKYFRLAWYLKDWSVITMVFKRLCSLFS
jgi:radical SAM superfamily enzyme YgiQ (UPF0313 family)